MASYDAKAAAGEWELMGDVNYRKTEVYELDWAGELDIRPELGGLYALKIAAAANGGPLAIVRDPRSLMTSTSASMRPTIGIYTYSGRTITHIIVCYPFNFPKT